MKKVHLLDSLMKAESGLNFPHCKADDKKLNLNDSRLITSEDIHSVSCKQCLKKYHLTTRF